MKTKWLLLLLTTVLVLAGGYYYFFVIKKAKDNPPTTKQEEVSKADLTAKNLADKYQAKTDWEEGPKFTLQLQERLITGKPTLLRGYVEDVFSRDDKIFIRLTSFPYINDYVIELECDQQIVDNFLKDPSNDYLNFDEYAIVADVKEVFKPIFKVGSSVQSEDYAQIEIDSSDFFVIKGTCIDMARLEDIK